MKQKVLLIGGFSEIIELCEDNDFEIVGILDRVNSEKIMGYSVLGSDDDAAEIHKSYGDIPVIITPDLPSVRARLVSTYRNIGFNFLPLISPRATISRYAVIGEGAIIHHGCNVSANAQIDAFVRLNVNSNVMHDCKIGKFSTVAPNAVLLGQVTVGEQAYIGANATLLPRISVGSFSIVGAGAVVTTNVAEHMKVKGVPAK